MKPIFRIEHPFGSLPARAARAGLLLAGALACSAAAHAELLGVDGGGPSGGAGASGPGLAGQPGNGPAPGLGGDRTMPRPGGNGGAGGGAGATSGGSELIHYGGGGGGSDSGGGGGIAIIDPMGAAGGNGGGVAQALSAGADLQSSRGGAGDDGGAMSSGSEPGGGGGGGGSGAAVLAGGGYRALAVSIVGGRGGAGGAGFESGGGGGGGHGIRIDAADVRIELLATQAAGGQGGDGGAGSGSSGGGGDGGHGLAGAANDLRLHVAADSTLRGGDGGASRPVTHRAGAGGAGGTGLSLSASRWQVKTAGLIQGGNGGRGEASREFDGGKGGAGGAGLALAGNMGTLHNRGRIQGGQGATGGTSVLAAPGAAGAGGVGVRIAGNGNRLVNAGRIAGGASADGQQADAVRIDGAGNTFELHAGSVLQGNAVATGSANVLALGGAQPGVFDVSALAAGAPAAWSGVPRYAGFAAYEKTGAGTWRLTGGNAAALSWTVRAGRLAVDAEMAGSAMTVAAGGTLGGTGTVGDTTVRAGGALAPGNSIGTLRVAGDLVFEPGSRFEVEADPDGTASDRVVVSGTADIRGGAVLHVGPEGGFEARQRYVILTAGQRRGQFDAVGSGYAYLAPALSYDATSVALILQRRGAPGSGDLAFADLADTANQRATARAVETLPAAHPVYRAIETLPEGAPPAAFDALSGEVHASTRSALLTGARQAQRVNLGRLRDHLGLAWQAGAPMAASGGAPGAAALPGAPSPAWAEVVGAWQRLDGDGNAAQVRQHVGGLFVGADTALANGWRVGGSLGFTDGRIEVDARASQTDVASYTAALYGGRAWDAGAGRLNLLAGAAYTWHDIASERRVDVGDLRQELTADYGASTTQLFTELSYAMPLGMTAELEPFAGLAWNQLRVRGFTETGGSAALSGASSRDDMAITTLGARVAAPLGAGATLRAMAGWRHAFGDRTPQSTLAFGQGSAFEVAGAPIARDAALLGVGAGIEVARNAFLDAAYAGEFGGGNRQHTASVVLRWRF
ncbi:autotransporter SphB2 [Bordetella pertussis]|uniref:autotransporter SphB2 n=1 Tax=Bordetella pertussis TaxID=520 RepID=UPI000F5EF3A0|nr:autotransporter SphB2 [Bordetella pertussis]AZI29979.1 autotransporter SphB2 [Bordetella pertussis]